MRPLQFQPTAGLTFEIVSETIVPIIYLDHCLIQRGEVFVSVPIEEPMASDAVETVDEMKEGAHSQGKASPQPPGSVEGEQAKEEISQSSGAGADDDTATADTVPLHGDIVMQGDSPSEPESKELRKDR